MFYLIVLRSIKKYDPPLTLRWAGWDPASKVRGAI